MLQGVANSCIFIGYSLLYLKILIEVKLICSLEACCLILTVQRGRTRKRLDTITAWTSQNQMVLERLQRQQQEWMSAQLAEHQKREERLISTIMESTLRSTERFVSLMIDGLRTVLPPHFSSSPGPPAFTSFHPVHPPPMYGLHVPQATRIHSEEEESQFLNL